MIVVDTLRADHVYGNRIRTPNMDALVRQGLRFTRAYPEAMPTVPARNSILSGRRQFPFRQWHDWRGLLDSPGWSPLRDVEQALPAVLRRAGYWTGYVTDNPFLGFSYPYLALRRSLNRFVRTGGEIGGRRSGVSDREMRHWLFPALHSDAKAHERLRHYIANSHNSHDESRSFAARVFSNGMRLLDEAAAHRPFALFLDTYEPHEPWTPPRKYVNLYGDPDYHGPEPGMPRYGLVSDYMRDHDPSLLLKRMRALYAAEVTMTDAWLGHFLDRFHQLGLDRDTAIVLVGDHGFLLGDYGWTGKISSILHPALMHVPMVVVDPARRRAGHSSDYLAQTHDLAPTLLSLAGVRAPRRMDGIDLSPLFEGRRPARALAGLRRLRQLALRPHGALEADRRQPRPQPAPVRREARPGRDAQPGQAPPAARRRDVRRGGQAGGRSPAVLQERPALRAQRYGSGRTPRRRPACPSTRARPPSS